MNHVFQSAFLAGALLCGALAAADGVVFPPDAGVIDVTQAPYNAMPDGQTDCTAALQQALDDHPDQGAIIYLPAGCYLISDTLKWPSGPRPSGSGDDRSLTRAARNTILQGQGQSKTSLRLPDGCAAFGDPGKPKAMLWTGTAPAQHARNAVRDLTLDAGAGNRGAIGLQFMANHQGCVRNVTIRAARASGKIGLDLGYTEENGPCFIQNLRVSGFDLGISTHGGINSLTFEHIVLEGQAVCGFSNDGQCVSIRDLRSANAVPALNNAAPGLLVLLDATLNGSAGAANLTALTNSGGLFVRNLAAPGYQAAIESGGGKVELGPQVAEFVSHPVLSLFAGPTRSLNLPVKETPDVPWDKLEDWISPLQFGVKPDTDQDATQALQAAIDSGKPTVYLPRGRYTISDTILIRNNVRRLIGCEAAVEFAHMPGKPGFKLVEGSSPAVVFERLEGGFTKTTTIENASTRTLVVRDCCNVCGAMTGSGDVFLEDVCANPFTSYRFGRQNVWCRQLNVENGGTHVVNDGGTLWLLGFKTERGGTLIETLPGGRTEVLGGLVKTTANPRATPMFSSTDAAVSLTLGEACFTGVPYQTLVAETRQGDTRVLVRGQAPARLGGSLLPLYVGYEAPADARK